MLLACFWNDESTCRRFGRQNRQRLRIHVITVLVRANYPIEFLHFLPLDRSSHEALMRLVGASIFLLEVV